MSALDADVIVIGAGAVGCAIARELSRSKADILVLEKECDVAYGTSGRNSAVVHAGFNNKHGSLMAKLCVEGNRNFEALAQLLDVPYKKTGKVLVAFSHDDMQELERIKARGEANGCTGLRLIGRSELRALAPNLNGIGGMFSEDTAIFSPFEYCIALAENAAANGAKFIFNAPVKALRRDNNVFTVSTDNAHYRCRVVINAAGLYCDQVSAMLGIDHYHIYPCRGEYFILDKLADSLLDIPAYPVPRPGIGGLGVHLTPTIEGNIIIGPSAEYIGERDDYASTREVMDKLFAEARELLPSIERRFIIGSYCGIRPKQAPPGEGGFRDFVIKDEESAPGFINLIGIESPGLTASVPIAEMVAELAGRHLKLERKDDFIHRRKGRVKFASLSHEEQQRLIAQNPDYGEIVCRCQNITKQEIRDAIDNPFGARSISSIKYRSWATTGRCNGGYCLARIADMLVNEYGIKPEEITYRSSGSAMFSGRVKG